MRRTVIKKSYYEIPEDATPQERWILNILNEYNLTMSSFAKKIHVSRQTVSYWIDGTTKISFANVCAICMFVDKHANPESIYKTINKKSH